MSLLAKTVIGFVGLGGASVASLVWANQTKSAVNPIAPPIEVVNTPAPSISESIQKLKDAGYKGCGILTTSGKKGTLFYVCVMSEADGANNPHFYYHDKDKNVTNSFPQLKQVKKSSSSQWEFQLFFSENGSKTVNTYYIPLWFRNLKDEEENLEKSCKLTQGSNNSTSSFTLRCNNSDVQKGIQI